MLKKKVDDYSNHQPFWYPEGDLNPHDVAITGF